MKRAISGLGGLAVSALFIAAPLSIAGAADMAVKAPPPVIVPAPVYSWTGCYIGGNAGGAWAKSDDVDVSITDGPFGSRTASGFVGGGQVGCDYQSGAWVIGLRGLFDAASLSASNISPVNATVFANSRFPWFSTASGRVGYLVTPAALIYGTGGAAWTRSEFTNNAGGTNAADITRSGWLAGGGVEYMFARNWSMFGEYNHFDFGTKTSLTSAGFLLQSKQSADVLMVGINYRFGSR